MKLTYLKTPNSNCLVQTGRDELIVTMLVASKTLNCFIHAFELCYDLRCTSPLVDNKSTLLGAHHDIAVLWHVKQISNDVFLRIEYIFKCKVVLSVLQLVDRRLSQ